MKSYGSEDAKHKIKVEVRFNAKTFRHCLMRSAFLYAT